MQDQFSIQQLLRTKLVEAQTKNPAFSLRAFATRLQIGAGPLSQILSGTRKVSRKMAEKICDRLLLDPTERADVLAPVEKTDSLDRDEILKLTADQFKVVGEWYYFAVLSLVKTDDFKNNPEWIAERLGITKKEAEQAIERLIRLGFLIQDSNGKLVHSKSRYRTSDDVTNLSVRKAHFQTLDLARESLEHDPVELRDFTTITLPTHPSTLPAAKELIRRFQNDLYQLMTQTESCTEVYRLSVELFPMTKTKKLSKQENKK